MDAKYSARKCQSFPINNFLVMSKVFDKTFVPNTLDIRILLYFLFTTSNARSLAYFFILALNTSLVKNKPDMICLKRFRHTRVVC